MRAKDSSKVLERKEEILAPIEHEKYTVLLRLIKSPEHRVVVSLGAGAFPALCGNLALLKIFDELNLREHIDVVWGTSAGACIGGAWASGTSTEHIQESLGALNRRGAIDIPWFRLATSVLMRPFGRPLPDGIINGRHFQKAVQDSLTVGDFDSCPTPFRCIACTDDNRLQRKVFRRGPLLPAILSSMSLPGLFKPRPRLPGEATGFYDGGLVERTPLLSPIAEHNRHHPDLKLIILGTHFGNEALPEQSVGFISRLFTTISALQETTWRYQIREAQQMDNVQLMMLNPLLDDLSLFNFARLEVNTLCARETFLDSLQNAKLALTFGVR